MQLSSILKAKLRALPDKPGCYLMRDSSGRIIYVGKAASLRKRVQSYFRAAALRSAPPKTRSLVHSVADLDVVTARNEADAILTENKLIKDYQPRFNILLRDDKRFPMLKIDLNQKWPRFSLCRIKREDSSYYFGPYLSSGAAGAALEYVETKFGLRKCAVPDPDEASHRHCINDIIRYCSAPCIGKISAAQYRERIDEAIAFLRGERPELLDELKNSMDQAAAELNFEKASVIRDALQLLFSATRQRAHIARTRGVSADMARSGLVDLQKTIGLARRPQLIHAVDISNISGKHAVGSMVAAVDGVCRPALYRRFRITTAEKSDDVGMMTEVITRHFRRLQKERGKMPDLLLVDGGVTQLRAARKALHKLGINGVDVAGLAKKQERIFLADSAAGQPVVLPPDSSALQLLQRVRDEAHRFAIAYHRRLRSRIIRESALDDISGLGESRKQKLLRAFGSLLAITRAPENEIAKLPGIGPVLARKIKSFLDQGQHSA